MSFGMSGRRRRPESVDDALWAYATSERLAAEENATFAEHPLISADIRWVAETLGRGPGLLADFGSGAGRASGTLAAMGWHCLAIDLSQPMLLEARKLAESAGDASILPIRGNLVRLDFLPPGSIDAGISLFSTLGMLSREHHRRRALAGMARALKPGGRLFIHAHNWWVHRWHRQGRRWMLADIARRWLGRPDFGNRQADYRGIPGVVIHNFTWPELASLIESVGLEIASVKNLHGETAADLGDGFSTRRWLAGGWLIEATRTARS